MNPSVAILTPAYNAGRFLKSTIQSVLAQTYPHWTMIIVDDGSTDDTAAIAQNFAAHEPRIRLFSQSNQGLSGARNSTLRHTPPDTVYLMCLDADDLLAPTALAELVAFLEQAPDAGAVLCGATVIDGDDKPQGRRKTYRFKMKGGFPRTLSHDGPIPFFNFYCSYGCGPFAMFRKRAVELAGEYDLRLFGNQDADMFTRVALNHDVHQFSRPLYLYRWHGNNMSVFNARNQADADLYEKLWAGRPAENPRETALLREARHFHRHWHPLILHGKFAVAALRNALSQKRVGAAIRATFALSVLVLRMLVLGLRSQFAR